MKKSASQSQRDTVMADIHISCSCPGVLSFWHRSEVSPHHSGNGPRPHPGGNTQDPDPHRTRHTLSCRTQVKVSIYTVLNRLNILDFIFISFTTYLVVAFLRIFIHYQKLFTGMLFYTFLVFI